MKAGAVVASIAAMAMLVTAASVSAAALSAVQFRDRMAQVWHDRTGTNTKPASPTSFDATASGGNPVRVNIDNAYQQYLADPASIDQIIVNYLQVLTDAGDTEAGTLDQLVVIVRPTNYLTASVAAGADLSKFLPTRPLAGDLSLFLAIDSPTAIRTASTEDIARWRIDTAAAWQRALANTKPRLGALQMIRMGDKNGASGIAADSGLAPSILTTPIMCGPEAPEGINRQVVLVISRDSFLFGVPDDNDSMMRFWRDAKAAIASGSTLSMTPITCRQGGWVAVPLP